MKHGILGSRRAIVAGCMAGFMLCGAGIAMPAPDIASFSFTSPAIAAEEEAARTFAFSPNEYIKNLNGAFDKVYERTGGLYAALPTDLDGMSACAIYNGNMDAVAIVGYIDPSGGNIYDSDSHGVYGLLAAYLTDDTSDLASVMLGLVMATDQTIKTIDEAAGVATSILGVAFEGPYSYNNVSYAVTLEGDKTVFAAKAEAPMAGAEHHMEQVAGSSEETRSFILGGRAFELPVTWSMMEDWVGKYESGEEMTDLVFTLDGVESSRILVQYDKVAEIMKIDTGSGNAILSAEDNALHFASILDEYHENMAIESENWITAPTGEQCYDRKITYDKEVNGEIQRWTERCMVIPINGNEAYFAVTLIAPSDIADTYLNDPQVVIQSLVQLDM